MVRAHTLTSGAAVSLTLLCAAGFCAPAGAADTKSTPPVIRFEHKDGGTQVLMDDALIVEVRKNHYLRFRATNQNDLWVGSERRPMNLCWAYADPGINEYVVRGVEAKLTHEGFELTISADQPSLGGEVKGRLKATWIPERAAFEYLLESDLKMQTEKFYANSAAGKRSKGRTGIEALDWHIEHVSLPDRLMSGKPDSPGLYDWFVFSEDQAHWTKSPKVHIVFVSRRGSYPTIGLTHSLVKGGVVGWLDNDQGGWLVYPESEAAGQKHSFGLCWMFFDVHFQLPGAVPARGSVENASLNYALRFVPVDAARSREITAQAHEVEWRARKEYQLPVMKMGLNDFKEMISGKDGQYMWWASSYDCYRDDQVGFDDTYSVSIKSTDPGPKAWYASCFGPEFQRKPIAGSFRVTAKVKTAECDGWVAIGATDQPECWPYNGRWPKDSSAVKWVRSKTLTGTNGWSELVLDVIVKPGSSQRWTIALEQHGKGQSWWDNVSVQSLDSASQAVAP